MASGINRKTFLAYCRRAPFGGRLTEQQVDGVTVLLDTWEAMAPDASRADYLAYILAGVMHETGGKMVPVREGFASSDKEARRILAGRSYAKPVNGVAYYGRGRIQNTWIENYRKLSKRFGRDLVKMPDLLITDSSLDARVTIAGHVEGICTGKALSNYFTDPHLPINDLWKKAKAARAIVNGSDKAGLVADYFKNFYEAILAAREPDKVAEVHEQSESADTDATDPTTPDGKPAAQSKITWAAVSGVAAAASPTIFGISSPWALGAFAIVAIAAVALVIVFRDDIRKKAGI